MGKTTVFFVETPWTRIVSDELWNAVQKRPMDTTNMNRQPKKYLLSGKIACEQCNRPMGVRNKRGRVKCSCRHEDSRVDCRDLGLNPQILEALAVQGLLKWIGSEADQNEFDGALRRAIKERDADYDRQRSFLLETMAEVDKELDRMLADLGQLSSEAARERFNRRFDERNEELQSYRAKYHEIQHLTADTKDVDKLSIALTADWIRENEMIQPIEGYEEVYEMLDAVIHKIQLFERPGLHHDVVITYRWSIQGQDEPIEVMRTFENLLIADDEVRKREEIRDLKKRVESGEFAISDMRMDAIKRHCPEFMHKFRSFSLLAAGTFAASLRNPDVSLMTLAHCFGCDKQHQLETLRGYSYHGEWPRFVAALAGEDALANGDLAPATVKVRRSKTPSMRDKLAMIDSPILRLRIVDPSHSDRELTDEEWAALMSEIGNERGTSFRGWAKQSDRKGLNTYLHVIRNNLRRSQIPEGMLTHSRVNRMLRHLDDEGISMAMIAILLRMQGETDLPDMNVPTKLSSPLTKWGAGPRPSHKIAPGVIRSGRKPLLAKRQAARTALLGTQPHPH